VQGSSTLCRVLILGMLGLELVLRSCHSADAAFGDKEIILRPTVASQMPSKMSWSELARFRFTSIGLQTMRL
jgi:hypothetical protein